MEENQRITDPEVLRKLNEEASFINSLMDLGELGEDIKNIKEIQENIPTEISKIIPEVDLVINRNGEYIPFNAAMVYIEHRNYYVDEGDSYWLDFQHMDEDVERIISVIDSSGDLIEVSYDYSGIVTTEDYEDFLSPSAAIDNGYIYKDSKWIKKPKDIIPTINKTNLDFYDGMEESLNKFYPGLWWYQTVQETFDFELSERYNILQDKFDNIPRYYPNVLIIKFPYIKITNSDNQEHIIEDLYVIIRSSITGQFSNMYGFRGKITDLEASNKYYHSHLPNSAYNEIGNFCLGSGPLAIILVKLKNQLIFNKDFFSYFLANLKVYVEWESIEGRPHRRINNILSKNILTIDEFEENTALVKRLEIRYNEVKNALARIESGTFGTCEISGEEIEHERLEANPAARTCIAHKEETPA